MLCDCGSVEGRNEELLTLAFISGIKEVLREFSANLSCGAGPDSPIPLQTLELALKTPEVAVEIVWDRWTYRRTN